MEPEDGPAIGAPLTLAAARALAAEIQRKRVHGQDVVADRKAEKRRRAAEIKDAAANSFGAAAVDFIERYGRPKLRRWRTTARHLGLQYPTDGDGAPTLIAHGLAERWADKPMAAIDEHDIYGVIDETRRSGAPGLQRRKPQPTTDLMARVVVDALSQMFTWLKKERRVGRNPCSGIHRPDKPVARDRVLEGGEIGRFWTAAGAERPEMAVLLRLLLLTGCRLNEVAGMRWPELSDDRATWTIPSSRTKNKRSHVVPLPPLARDLIASLTTVEGTVGYVFTTNGRVPVSGWTRIKRRLDAAMRIPPWRLHDVRRSFVTGLAELGIRPDVIELAVNHRSGMRGGIAGTYNRSELLPERRAALETWASHVEGLIAGGSARVLAGPGLRVGQQ
jgi:integrase